jgi:hypothetical protein
VQLVDALFEHRRRDQVGNTSLKIISFGELVNTPSEILVARDLVQDPIEHALRHHIKLVGKYLAPQLTINELLQLVERVGGGGNDNARRVVAIEHCFDGLQTKDGGIWAS